VSAVAGRRSRAATDPNGPTGWLAGWLADTTLDGGLDDIAKLTALLTTTARSALATDDGSVSNSCGRKENHHVA
jgi:hypothetical protein